MNIIKDFLLHFINSTIEYTWNNIIILRIVFILFIILVFIVLIFCYYYRNKLYSLIKPYTFDDLCIDISKILLENKNRYREFAQISDVDSSGNPYQKDIKIWEYVKNNVIEPNNNKILDLISKYYNLIPDAKLPIFEKFKNHSIAFSAHNKDNTIDYRNNRFPKEFEDLIYVQCINFNKKQQDDIILWLRKEFIVLDYIQIDELWVFGSILKSRYSDVNDIDIIVYDSIITKKDMKENVDKLDNLKIKFKQKFKKELHISLYSKSEKKSLNDFINLIDIKRKG